MAEIEALSKQLRRQYDDLLELYNDAKLNDNAAGMEKLAKLTSSLAKQIKEHEEHEKVTLQRDDLKKLTLQVAMTTGRAIKRYVDDKERAVLIIEQITEDLIELVDAYDGD
jgi:undecaprenyl pyrophosphate synthase